MILEQLRSRGIKDEAVLGAMAAIPRDEFVPEELRARAYEDNPLPIGYDQTISQPYIVALMSELLELTGSERVLEIGAGCGYQSAILSKLCRQVCALELEEPLAIRAQQVLTKLGIRNVDLRAGDGFAPWPEGGEFDAILCACAPPDVPPVCFEQLAIGGRLVLPIGRVGTVQKLQRWRKDSKNNLHCEDQGGVRFVPMRHPRSLS